MPRKVDKRKPETVIRELRQRLNEAANTEAILRTAYRLAKDSSDEQRTRATKAETEAAEWKRRFDALLAAIPELRKVTTGDAVPGESTNEGRG
jgi:hypothetical protein